MSAVFTHSDLPTLSPWTASSVLRNYRAVLCSELLVESERRHINVLCVGAGALRSAETVLLSRPFSKHHTVTVLDDDPSRIAACKQEYGATHIRYVEGRLDEAAFEIPGEYDFVYNLNGLITRSAKDAQIWLERVINLVAARGMLLLGCFTPEWARMESQAASPWGSRGVLRDEHQLALLIAGLRTNRPLGHSIWRDESGALAYLQIAK